jgi:hypothetical protein
MRIIDLNTLFFISVDKSFIDLMFRVQFRVPGSGFWVPGSGFWVPCLKFKVKFKTQKQKQKQKLFIVNCLLKNYPFLTSYFPKSSIIYWRISNQPIFVLLTLNFPLPQWLNCCGNLFPYAATQQKLPSSDEEGNESQANEVSAGRKGSLTNCLSLFKT